MTAGWGRGWASALTVLLVGSYFVMIDEATIGVVVAFISGFQRLADPLSALLTYYRTAAQANVQHRMIAEWMTGQIEGSPGGAARGREGLVAAD